MQTLSALDAISPAFARTRLVLFSPFRVGRTWKLAATGYLATAATIFLPSMLIYLGFLPVVRRFGTGAVWALIGGIVLLTALYVWVFYLCTRIRFAFFDIVLHREEFVRPPWRKYGPQAMRWTVFKIVLGIIVMAVMVVPMWGYTHHMMAMMGAMMPGHPPSRQMMASIFGGYALMFLLYLGFGLFFFVSSLLSDFIVPSLALEDTGLPEAFRRMGRLIRGEPGQFTLYCALKLGLGLAGYFGIMLVFEIVVFLVALLIFLAGWGIGVGLHAMGVPWLLLEGLAIALGIGFCLFFFIYCLLLALGALLTFLEAYTLYFLGGRYPLLGDLLEQSTPPPPAWGPAVGYPAPGYGYPPQGWPPPYPTPGDER